MRTSLECYWGLTEACPRNGKITSLSTRGCFIKTTAEAGEGQTVYLNCWLPSDLQGRLESEPWMMVRGRVIYHLEKIGFGMQFTELTAAENDIVLLLIEHFRNDRV
ncbi:MAG TPA: hypothetical protein VF723_12020 [Pyrinomonadaceae bacterium]